MTNVTTEMKNIDNESPKGAVARDGKPFVITVGREFGSGGRELARALADELGIAYYDKELLVESAKLAGIEPEFFEQKDERFPSFLHGCDAHVLLHRGRLHHRRFTLQGHQ